MTKAGFYMGNPYSQLLKHYQYHGLNRACPKPPDPEPFDDVDVPLPSDEAYFVFTNEAISATQLEAILEGELVALGQDSHFLLKGFKYWVDGESDYKIAFELGEFVSETYQLVIDY